ncbi:MAG: DEAD/DEAH box helicase [Anaerolineae bacterium]|nr:DEAD/DEAH box helicase [Anaerolineae bacterium]
MTEFSQLNLKPELLQAIADEGYTEPTPIQTEIIPRMLAKRDVIGQAQTGTGKTAAFALPMLQNLKPGQGYVQGLVLAPTRELAMQVSKAMYAYGQHTGVRVLAVYGGTPYGRQISRLSKGVDIVVGTPGRLLDHINRGTLDLSQTNMVVLDEADEMLSMGFIEDIESILDKTSAERQTALFSATMPDPIRKLADKYLRNPELVAIKQKHLTVSTIDQRYYIVNEKDKLSALTRLFEIENLTTALVFAKTRVATGELANELSNRGFQAEALNGDLSQEARERVLERFRNNQIQVLVATDVAARGLDIDDISHVFNYDLPQDPEVYVHRVGRTGRAGKEGVAISLFTPREQGRLRRIENVTRQKITKADLPTINDIEKYREEGLVERMLVWLRRDRCNREKEIVAELIEEGYDVSAVAAAALKLARVEEKQRPIPAISDVSEFEAGNFNDRNNRGRGRRTGSQPNRGNLNKGTAGVTRSHANGDRRQHGGREKGMVRLTLNKGKVDGVRPNDVVGTIAYHANIPGKTIGAIRIQPQHTFVDVPEQFVTQVLDKSGSYEIHRERVTVEMA